MAESSGVQVPLQVSLFTMSSELVADNYFCLSTRRSRTLVLPLISRMKATWTSLCTVAALLSRIPPVVIGESVNFRGEEGLLGNRGTVVVVDEAECKESMGRSNCIEAKGTSLEHIHC